MAKEFNIRFNGSSVSVQTASNWLMEAGIPNQEKLIVLAAWLQVSPEWLRFGEPQLNSNKVESSKAIYAVGVQTQLQDLPDKIAKLSPRQKQAVYNVVEAMLEEKPKNI